LLSGAKFSSELYGAVRLKITLALGERLRADWRNRNVVSEFSKSLSELLRAAFLSLGIGFGTVYDIADAVMEDFPE
jgi:hypothetical protein